MACGTADTVFRCSVESHADVLVNWRDTLRWVVQNVGNKTVGRRVALEQQRRGHKMAINVRVSSILKGLESWLNIGR